MNTTTNPNYLTIEQMDELQQFGPFDISDTHLTIFYQEDEDGYNEYTCIDDNDTLASLVKRTLNNTQEGVYRYKTYSLNDLLVKLPKYIQTEGKTYGLEIDMTQNTIFYVHRTYDGRTLINTSTLHDEYTNTDNIIDAVYKMFLWVLNYFPGKINIIKK